MYFDAPIPLLVVDIYGIPAGVLVATGWRDCQAADDGWELICRTITAIADMPAGVIVQLGTLADQGLYAHGLLHLQYPA